MYLIGLSVLILSVSLCSCPCNYGSFATQHRKKPVVQSEGKTEILCVHCIESLLAVSIKLWYNEDPVFLAYEATTVLTLQGDREELLPKMTLYFTV